MKEKKTPHETLSLTVSSARASHPLGALPLSESGDETAQAFKESNISSNASSSSVSVMRKDLESVIFKGKNPSFKPR